MQETLGKRNRQPDTSYAPLQRTVPQLEEKAGELRIRLAGRGQELMDKLAEVSIARGWKVHRVSGPEGAMDYICNLATSNEARLVVRSQQEVFQTVQIDGPLGGMGVEVTVMAQDSGLSRDELRQQSSRAGIGITGVDYAVAETGSVVVLPSRGLSRLVSLVPPVHVAIVRPQDVLETLEDVFMLRRLANYRGNGDMGSYMNFITGPSRTADIEQTLVIGVHGPKEAHLVLLG